MVICILTSLEPNILINTVQIIAAILVVTIIFIIRKQPESKTKLSFKVNVLGHVARIEVSGRWLEEEVHVLACIRRGTLAKRMCIEYRHDVSFAIPEKLERQKLLQRCGWKGRAGPCI